MLELGRKIKPKDASLRKLEDELIAIFGTKVQLNHKGKKGGSIIVDYFSDDDLTLPVVGACFIRINLRFRPKQPLNYRK